MRVFKSVLVAVGVLVAGEVVLFFAGAFAGAETFVTVMNVGSVVALALAVVAGIVYGVRPRVTNPTSTASESQADRNVRITGRHSAS